MNLFYTEILYAISKGIRLINNKVKHDINMFFIFVYKISTDDIQ